MSGELSSQIQELRLLMGSPRDPEGRAFAQLGDALRRDGRLDEALDVLREGVGRHPLFTPGHLALAWALQEGGAEDEALGAFQEALELDPENPYALFGAGRLLAAMGREEGIQMVEAAQALDPAIQARAPQRLSGPGAEIPFVPLAELAPEQEAEEDALPFVPLVDLAPDHELEEDALPFVPLLELAPDTEAVEAELPFVPLSELAPDQEEAEAALPFVALAELAPDEAHGLEEPAASPMDALAAPATHRPDPGHEPAGVGAVEARPGEVEDASPVTRTMAELFASQGLPDRAIRIYERLLEAAPGEAALLERLAELKAQVPAEDAGATPEVVSPDPLRVPERDTPELHPALEVPDTQPLSPSPYGWEADGEERAPRGSATSAGAYFSRLLAWTPGNPAREADEATAPDPPLEPEGGDG